MAKKNLKRVKVLVANLAGKYNLPYAKNEVIEIDPEQAEELIDAGDAREYSKEIEAKEKKEAAEGKKAADKKPEDKSGGTTEG